MHAVDDGLVEAADFVFKVDDAMLVCLLFELSKLEQPPGLRFSFQRFAQPWVVRQIQSARSAPAEMAEGMRAAVAVVDLPAFAPLIIHQLQLIQRRL